MMCEFHQIFIPEEIRFREVNENEFDVMKINSSTYGRRFCGVNEKENAPKLAYLSHLALSAYFLLSFSENIKQSLFLYRHSHTLN